MLKIVLALTLACVLLAPLTPTLAATSPAPAFNDRWPHHTQAQRDETPNWSPNGKQIVFQTDRIGGAYRIAVMDSDGANVTMLTR